MPSTHAFTHTHTTHTSHTHHTHTPYTHHTHTTHTHHTHTTHHTQHTTHTHHTHHTPHTHTSHTHTQSIILTGRRCSRFSMFVVETVKPSRTPEYLVNVEIMFGSQRL